ncbi:MAG: WbqC family protein [Bacteroidales bacterium]|nr:WbqC family protein [Bacteroidales bacterium]
MALLSIAFLPPIEYFVILAKYSVIQIEACENYQKQSYRNRCKIYAADGVQAINVPVVHENGTFKLPITQIKVDYSTPWMTRAKRAIDAAYYSSAYFEYYRDSLYAILDSKPETLFGLDLELTRYLAQKCGIKTDIGLTQDFLPGTPGEDFREVIHPKSANTILEDNNLKKPYFQVFSQKYGFLPNLSVIDLLFNEGPDAFSYLKPPSEGNDSI